MNCSAAEVESEWEVRKEMKISEIPFHHPSMFPGDHILICSMAEVRLNPSTGSGMAIAA
jgi:hypothetical protein